VRQLEAVDYDFMVNIIAGSGALLALDVAILAYWEAKARRWTRMS
jgi:hypothetical protein